MATRSKKKQIKQKDFMAEQGLSTKVKKGLTLKSYIYIKVGLIIALPIIYFLYSPLLIFVLLGFIVSYVLAFKAERTENQSVAKANRISLFKLDAALALIVIVVAVGGMISDSFSVTAQSFMKDLASSDFDDDDDDYAEMQWRMFWRELSQNAVTLGACSTGKRTFTDYLSGSDDFSFSKGGAPPGGGGAPGGGKPASLSVDDLPIDFLMKTMLSMINSILVGCVFVSGISGIVLIYVKKNKQKKEEVRETVDFSNSSLTDEAIENLIAFGDVDEIENALFGVYSAVDFAAEAEEVIETAEVVEETAEVTEEVIETAEVVEETAEVTEEVIETAEVAEVEEVAKVSPETGDADASDEKTE